MTINFSQTAAFIWSVADLLRGDFKQSQYGRIILPFTLLRRLECVLEQSKPAVLAKHAEVSKLNLPEVAYEMMMLRATDENFFNVSPMDLSRLGESGIKDHLENYIQCFSKDAREIFEYFKLTEIIAQLNDANLLYIVVQKFANTDLNPKAISPYEMGLVFEELIRLFAESANETTGEHFTPRDIVRLTTALVIMEDDDALTQEGIVRTIYDPTAGTGGFLSRGLEYVNELNPKAFMSAFGQELNHESVAICKADMLIKGQEAYNIKLGNTLSSDQFSVNKFDYMLSNPPFGLNWKQVESDVKDEYASKGFDGRFGPGLPRVSDGSLLFLLHLISKLPDAKDGGGRIGIILNGSPLMTGDAGSGESEIRRYVLESDLLEAIIALPGGAFYNTAIPSFILILTNRKKHENIGRLKLIDARSSFSHMRKRIGLKSIFLGTQEIEEITKAYGGNSNTALVKEISCTDCGYRVVKLNLPKGKFQYEEIPLLDDIDAFLHERLKDVFPDLEIDNSYVDTSDNKLGRVLYRLNFDELFSGFRRNEGTQFRTLFEEVEGTDSFDFSVRMNLPKVSFNADSDRKKGFCYFKIRDKNIIDYDYLKLHMESGKGDEWISKYTTDGTAMKRISKLDLMQSIIGIPLPSTQKNIVSLMADVNKIEEGLRDFVGDLWKKTNVSYDGERLKLPLSLDFQEQFVRVSPFPLANILHHYGTLDDYRYKERYELLLKYFESLAIFLVSSLIGYLININDENSVFSYLKKQKRFFKNATFGTWSSLLKNASDEIGVDRSSADHKFIELLANSKISELIEEAKNIRNKTTGHGSIPTKEAANKILRAVESLLERSYELTYLIFDGYDLVRPINSVWNGHEHTYSVQVFSGLGCYPFSQSKIKLTSLLIDGELYLISKQKTEVIQLFPFVKLIDMMVDSGLDAFYFYSGLDNLEVNEENNNSTKTYKYISQQQINNQTQVCTDTRLDRIFL